MHGTVHEPPKTTQPVATEPTVREDTRQDNVEVFPVHNAPMASPPDANAAAGVERRRAPRTAKPSLFVTVCHWAMVLLLGLNLLSGMRIGWGYKESPLGGQHGLWSTILTTIAPTGTMFGVNLITLHVILAFAMFLVAGVYVVYLYRSHTTRRLEVTRKDLQRLADGVRTKTFWRNKPALWSANVLTYWLGFTFIGVLVLSGVALYRLDWGLSNLLGGYSFMRLVHALVSYLLIPYAVLHMVLQWAFGRFWTIFKAHAFYPHVQAGLYGLALILPVVAGLYLWNALPTTLTAPRLGSEGQTPGLEHSDGKTTLTVTRLVPDAPAPVLDGDPSDAIWSQVQAVHVRTVKGVNNPRDYADVVIKAVHDGTQIYFLFQWDDPNVSFMRYPLLKTEHGWKVLQTAFENADENLYYEDKLSVYFTNVVNGSCADTCHLGVGPYSKKNEKHGLHYTKGEVGDVWHWKSVRTDPMGELIGEPGFMDDQHFKAPDPMPTEYPKQRYSGGYHADPKSGGGYDYNFEKLAPGKRLEDTYVRPKMFPATLTISQQLDSAASQEGEIWWIHKSQGLPYAAEADTYPVGTIIPNIIIEPFQGDRADVRAKAAWKQGRWTLEARRALDTKSEFDVPFVIGKPVYLTVATYNRTQTRHGEHITPITVMLQP